jgi:hypothetical protein
MFGCLLLLMINPTFTIQNNNNIALNKKSTLFLLLNRNSVVGVK